jgi:phage gp29-like protein
LADTTAPKLIEYAGIGGGKDYTRGFVGAIHKWLPSQDSLLEQKSGGDLELYELVSQDDQVKSCLQQRFRALLAKDWEVIPGGEKRIDKQAAEHLEKQLEAINWDNCNEKMLFGIHYGYSAAEILWERQDDKVGIAAIKVRNRRRFHFNADQQLVLKTMQNPLGEDLPERKFWHFCAGADHDDEPYGRGLGHWLYWPTFFKRNGVRWWLKFVEKYAQPTRLGKYPAGATENEKGVLWDALGSFGDDARSMIPEGLEMEFLESSRAGTVDYKSLCDQMDAAIAKIILSQTMTTDNGSSRSQAEVHEGVKDEVIESDSDLLCESFNNSVAVWLTDWNFPGAAYPKVRRKIQVDPDPATMADTDTKLQGLGISLKPEAIAAKYGEDYLVPDNADSIPQLNGEQVNALVSIITNAKQGGWSPELVAGMINGAFPNWPDDAVAAITKNLGDPTPVAGQVPDPNTPAPTSDPNTPQPTAQSLDDVAAQFAASGKKNCKTGLSCGGSCISRLKICDRELDGETRALVALFRKRIKKGDAEAVEKLDKLRNAQNARSKNKAEKSNLDYLTSELENLSMADYLDKFKAKLVMKRIQEELLNTGLSIEQAAKIVDEIKMPELIRSSVEEAAIDFLRITNGIGAKKLKEFVRTSNRAHAEFEAGVINIGLARKREIFHEMGHFAEDEVDGSVQKNTDWVKSRATGAKQRLSALTGNKNYDTTELAYPDNFYNPYVGKTYPNATEVMSMGLEKFRNTQEMVNLWQQDKEHFKLVIDFLKETRNVSSQS